MSRPQTGRPEGRPVCVSPSDPDGLTISYLGHETLLLALDGVRMLTDPVLRMRIQLLQRHGPLPNLSVTKNLDAVLISHLHLDHVNPASLRLLPRTTPLVVPTGARAILRPYRFTNLHELAPGESLRFGDVTVTATFARHAGRRYPWGRFAGAVGYTVQGSFKVYFAGDTGFFDGLTELANQLDVALLPIWGWGLRLPDDHLSPETAAQALQFLKPRLAIPIHWGTFLPLGARRFYGHYLTDPPRDFVRHAQEYAPEVRTVVLPPGESITLQKSGEAGQGEGRTKDRA
jgi:L-ascorbate metabolism protein UlaG (beta-lactamase superfamily)